MKDEKYHVLTGTYLVQPYRTNSYFKAFIALLYRKIRFGRGYILRSQYKIKNKPQGA